MKPNNKYTGIKGEPKMRVSERLPVLTVAITEKGSQHLQDEKLQQRLNRQERFVLELLQEDSYDIETTEVMDEYTAKKLSPKLHYLTALNEVLTESILTTVSAVEDGKRMTEFYNGWIAHVDLLTEKLISVTYAKGKQPAQSFSKYVPSFELTTYGEEEKPSWLNNILEVFTAEYLMKELEAREWVYSIDDLLPTR